MYIIIIGLGGIGRTLAGIAAERGDSVVVIDKNEARCNEVLEHYDVMAIVGNAVDKEILEDAGIDRADAFITTTSDDAVNLMSCLIAKKYEVPDLISIVNQIEHSDLFNEIGVKTSENPDQIVAERLYYRAQTPNLQQLATVPGGTIFEVTVDEGAPCVDKEIRELTVKDFVFIAISRQGKELIIPNGLIRLQAGDAITVFTKKNTEEESSKIINMQLKANTGSTENVSESEN